MVFVQQLVKKGPILMIKAEAVLIAVLVAPAVHLWLFAQAVCPPMNLIILFAIRVSLRTMFTWQFPYLGWWFSSSFFAGVLIRVKEERWSMKVNRLWQTRPYKISFRMFR